GSGSEWQQLSCTCVASVISRLPHVTMPDVVAVLHERPPTHFAMFVLQKVDAQSASARQVLVSGQGSANVGAAPPQSMSVSLPFFRPSDFDAGSHTSVPRLQRTFAQSPSPAQPWPGGQRVGAVGPPQSTPVSSPLCKPSVCE